MACLWILRKESHQTASTGPSCCVSSSLSRSALPLRPSPPPVNARVCCLQAGPVRPRCPACAMRRRARTDAPPAIRREKVAFKRGRKDAVSSRERRRGGGITCSKERSRLHDVGASVAGCASQGKCSQKQNRKWADLAHVGKASPRLRMQCDRRISDADATQEHILVWSHAATLAGWRAEC